MDDESPVADAIEHKCEHDGCNSAAVHVPILPMILIVSFFTFKNVFRGNVFI